VRRNEGNCSYCENVTRYRIIFGVFFFIETKGFRNRFRHSFFEENRPRNEQATSVSRCPKRPQNRVNPIKSTSRRHLCWWIVAQPLFWKIWKYLQGISKCKGAYLVNYRANGYIFNELHFGSSYYFPCFSTQEEAKFSIYSTEGPLNRPS